MIIADHRRPDNTPPAQYPRLHFLRDPRGWISIELTTDAASCQLPPALSVERMECLGVRGALRSMLEGGQ